jgi:anti-sigma factor RsiW
MKQCVQEGDLRAYLDRELPGPDRDRVAAHLATCGECDASYREIAARAERVATALSALADGIAPVRVAPVAPAQSKVRLWPRWAAAVGMAAGLALLLLAPKTTPPSPASLALKKAEFVALDNEPIDAGLVVRVSLGPDNIQADVIISADGRARAYRLVSNQN